MTDKINTKNNKIYLPVWQVLLFALLSALISAASATIGSVLLCCISGLLFAYVFYRGGVSSLTAAPIAYAVTFLFLSDPLASLAALAFLPIGFALSLCVGKKRSLSVTAAILTVAVALASAVLFMSSLYRTYGGLSGSLNAYFEDFKSAFRPMLQVMKEMTDENGYVIFTEQAIAEIKEYTLMTAPAVLIIVCEVLAVIMSKIYISLFKVFKDTPPVKRPWQIHTSLPTYLLFAVSYFACMIASSSEIIFYSALNIMLILIPFTSISGFHSMFGGSFFRSTEKHGLKIFTVIMCVVFLFINPVLLLSVFSFWGAFDSIRNYFISGRKNDTDSSDEP